MKIDLARSSNEPSSIGVMRARLSHLPGLTVLLGAMLAVMFFAACGDGPTEPPPDPPRATSITVSPATADLAALGATVQFSAEVRDQNGQAMAGAAVTWASSTADVATVSASGQVTAVANGSATITATSGPTSGGAIVTVAQEVSRVTVTPDTASLAALGATVRLSAAAFDANGSAVAGAEFSWESSDEAVATVSASGLVAAVANGSATITATSGSASGGATVTVAQEVSRVTVTPATASLAAVGATVLLSAVAFDANGSAVAGAEFSWESSDEAVATVSASGLVTAVASGIATITVTARDPGGLTASKEARIAVSADRDILETLYHATGGPNWRDNTNWLSDKPLGKWRGVFTDADGRVVRLHLGVNSLTGEIPPELGSLSNLGALSLGVNSLTGEIPPELGNLSNLWYLTLDRNSLTGEIPPELGNLSNLGGLYLDGNSLTGEIPSSFLAIGSLSRLWFDDNSGLCAPNTSAFTTWLNGIDNWRGRRCR